MKIEEYLGSLPQGLVTGEDIQLQDRSFRDAFKLAGLGPGDVLYHLGCGDGRGLEIAQKEFGARSVGIDCNRDRVSAARARGLEGAEVILDDVRNQEIADATVVLLWFTEQEIVEDVVAKLGRLAAGCRIVTVFDPLLDYRPDEVLFPYLLYRTPLKKAASLQEQVLSIFGVKCIDFVTAWEHAERYTKSLGGPNDRFLTIMQTLVIWINARNLGVACGSEIPESIQTYMSILREFFGIEVEHLLRKGGG